MFMSEYKITIINNNQSPTLTQNNNSNTPSNTPTLPPQQSSSKSIVFPAVSHIKMQQEQNSASTSNSTSTNNNSTVPLFRSNSIDSDKFLPQSCLSQLIKDFYKTNSGKLIKTTVRNLKEQKITCV